MLESNNRKTKTHHNSARSGESMWILCEPGLVLLGTPSSHLRATGATVSSTVFTSGSCTNLSSNAYQMCVKYTEGYIDSVKYLTYIAIVAMYSQCISIYFIIFHNESYIDASRLIQAKTPAGCNHLNVTLLRNPSLFKWFHEFCPKMLNLSGLAPTTKCRNNPSTYSSRAIQSQQTDTEPGSHPFEKENHLPNLQFWVPCSFSRV